MRPLLTRAAFAVLAWGLGGLLAADVHAACSQSKPILSFDAPQYSYLSYPLSPEVGALFWALGFGDPADGAGVDSGSLSAIPGILATVPGYPAWIESNWNRSGVDGCILDNEDADCTALAVYDRDGSCTPWEETCVSLAVATDEDPGPGQPFSFAQANGATIELSDLPVVLSDYNAADQEPLPIFSVNVPAPSEGLYLDAACDDPLAGYRIYINWSFTPLLPSTPIDRSNPDWTLVPGGSGPDGAPIPFGTPTMLHFGCNTWGYAYLAYEVVLESGFEIPHLTLFVNGSFFNSTGLIPCCPDGDADGYCSPTGIGAEDCDNTNPDVLPHGPQICGDGLNNDCFHAHWPDLEGTNEFDDDGDGFSECDGDCEDGEPSLYPGIVAPEICDGLDQNCDGRNDEAPVLAQRLEDADGADGAHFGITVAGLGDADGDGVEEFVVGARRDTVSGILQAGRAVVLSGATRAELHTLTHPAPAAGDNFARSVAGIDDVNGDGIRDILVGAPLDDAGGIVDSGSAHVFSGSAADDFEPIHALVDPAAGPGDELGYSVAALGDVDDDGVGDIVVGARNDDGRGSALVFSGAGGGFIRKLTDPAGQVGDLFGYAVTGSGDLDGDDVPDVLIGAYAADSAVAPGAGEVTAFSGADGGAIRTFADPAGTGGDEFGRGLASIADLDGDGVDDLLAGAPGASAGGEVLLFSGADAALLDRATDPEGEAGDSLGYRVAALGDMDADGVADFVAGAFTDDATGSVNSGSATVFSGATRLPIRKLIDPDGATGDVLGAGLAGIGDLDADGTQELVIGAYLTDRPGKLNSGAALLFWGAAVEDLDGDGFGDRCDPDIDGDGAANEDDCAPLDNLAQAIPPEVEGIGFSPTKTTLRWTDQPGLVLYDIFRDDQDPGFSCWISERQVPQVQVVDPPPGEVTRLLVRGTNVCGRGTLGSDGEGEERTPAEECP
ncbi:MAG: hypothetical protein GY716_01325 [bacterium]|nr:hypothetical protein [bacterium]